MTSAVEKLLNLPGTKVAGYQQLEGYICLHLKFTSRGINCRHCQEYTQQFYQATFIIDMWAGFPKVITSVFPKAAVVFDRFHVMKLVNEALNKMRKQVGVKVKGSRFLILKNSQDLTELEQKMLEQLLNQSACLRIAYEMKEEFRSIYETSQTVQSGLNRMKKWLAQAQVFYPKAVQTIRAHLEGICNYFISHTTSGVMEGINNKAKLIMRQGYGFTDFDNFRARLLGSFSD